ncbi:solute carrier family 2, facilitated glucose transporter member 5-like [Podarcis lilfordi]|uniref:Solute carrier family 2, facilitated glucose transporter member 5 n=2 Tax=Podarcis lilfordi TaxID=74358 RepID=A0AA35P7Z0_9SAUR|nr:solute carrier family 2, facilitated glucose transporter member 5-like [Podarcis lilfordi]
MISEPNCQQLPGTFWSPSSDWLSQHRVLRALLQNERRLDSILHSSPVRESYSEPSFWAPTQETMDEIEEVDNETINTQMSSEKTTNIRVSSEETTNTRVSSEETTNTRVSSEETTNIRVCSEETINTRVRSEGTTSTWMSLEGTTNTRVRSEETTNTRVSSEGTTNTWVSSEGTTNTQASLEETPKTQESSKLLIWVSVASCLLSQCDGYNMWLLYSPTVFLHDLYNTTMLEELGNRVDSKLVLATIPVALFPFGAICGSFPVAWLMDRFGRKGALMIADILYIICSVLLGLSHLIRTYGYSLFINFCFGLCSGITFCVVSIYLGEISPIHLRGRIMMMHSLFSSFGVLLAQILSLPEIIGTRKGLPILTSISVVMPLLQVFLLPLLPESPRYLFIQKEDENNAIKVLKKLRDTSDVDDEIEELQLEDIIEKDEKNMDSLKLMMTPSLKWHVIRIFVLMGGEQLDGLNAAYYYKERIISPTKSDIAEIHLLLIIGSTVYSCAIALSMYLADSKGHKFLLLVGSGICIVTCIMLTMSLDLMKYIPHMVLVRKVLENIFIFGHGIGSGSISSVIVVELFLQSSRASAFAIAGFVHWLSRFLIEFIFFYIEASMGAYIFLLFWPVSVATFFVIFRIIPETKMKAFVQIRRSMLIPKPRKKHTKKRNIN